MSRQSRRNRATYEQLRNAPRWLKITLTVLGMILFILSYSGIEYFKTPAPDFVPEEQAPLEVAEKSEWPRYIAKVVRVVDGDTLLVESGGRKERVRLLKVDTAESVAPEEYRNTAEGKLASDFTKRELEGRQVTLEYDPEEPMDQYGRRLVYVFVEGENFNVRLVREGWSKYEVRFGRSKLYDKEFREAERLRLSR